MHTSKRLDSLSNGYQLSAEDIANLNELNKVFTHVLLSGKNKILCKKPCPINGSIDVFLSPDEFCQYVSHRPRVSKYNLGKAWLMWEGKAFKEDGVGFYPDISKCPETIYNMYSPPAIEGLQGDVSLYLEHLLNIICNGDQEAFKYLVEFLAHIIQKPSEKPSVAILMKSVEGTGKGTLVKPILEILGCLGVHLNGHHHLTGQFNSSVANKLLIFADEVDLTQRGVADKFKSIVSERTIQMEKKGLEPIAIPNYSRIILASNHNHVIHAGLRERRYLVLEPSAEKAQDPAYFKTLHTWLHDAGAQKIYHYLSQFDLSDFNPHKAPITAALLEQKLHSLPVVYQFIYSILQNSEPLEGQTRIPTSDLVRRYMQWCDDFKLAIRPASARIELGKLMKILVGEAIGRSDRGGKYYEIPKVALFRESFANELGAEARDIFE